MELERVTAEIRPRTQWEAIDLGLSLTRAHAGLLMKIWLGSVLPLSLVILALFWNALFWGCFLIWWLKPIWERVALYPLSRSLFGETPKLSEAMKVLPRELIGNWKFLSLGVGLALLGWLLHREGGGNSLGIFFFWLGLFALVFMRSNLYRSLILPVRFLEGLNKSDYRKRAQALSFRSAGAASALTVLCLLTEVLVFLSQIFFVIMMVPLDAFFEMDQIIFDFFEHGPGIIENWVLALIALFYLFALSVVSWFYVGGGFGLYVNSRTWIEGWDIELTFKRLGQRLGLLMGVLTFTCSLPRASAEIEELTVEEVLAGEDFEVHTREDWVRKDRKKDEGEGASDSGETRSMDHSSSSAVVGVFAPLGEMFFWMFVVVTLAGLIWLIVTNLQAFKRGATLPAAAEGRSIQTVAGMNVAPESLPDDVIKAARKLWDEGYCREALALLYRAAISSLIIRQLVEIEESDTEMDCLRRVVASGEKANPVYFEELTRAWMNLAYGRENPSDEAMARVWSGWPFKEGGHR